MKDRVTAHAIAAIAAIAVLGCASVLASSRALFGSGAAPGASARYAHPAPLAQYRSPSTAEEIALARSAAPPSISSHATVLVLGQRGYDTAATGTNGFVCFVERSWAADFDDPQFWNPKIRGPNCFNAIAARTELPQYLARTTWVLSGASMPDMIARTRAAFANHTFEHPAAGALSYMLSKRGNLGDDANGPWLPHVMVFVPHAPAAAWGAGAKGSPITAIDGSDVESTVLLIPVRRWSDGSPAPPAGAEPGLLDVNGFFRPSPASARR